MRLVCIVNVWKSSMLWAITVILFCQQLTIIKHLLRIISFLVSLLYLVGCEHLDFFLMNDPQPFFRGKLIHGPGAWLTSPSPPQAVSDPNNTSPLVNFGRKSFRLLAMFIVQPVCEASRCCPRWPSSPPWQALTRSCTRCGRPGHTEVRTEGDKPHNWARAGPRLPSSAIHTRNLHLDHFSTS